MNTSTVAGKSALPIKFSDAELVRAMARAIPAARRAEVLAMLRAVVETNVGSVGVH